MCCPQLDLVFIFKMAATRIMQKMKVCHISVTSHHMKTNYGSTSRFCGTGDTLVALFLSFKVKGAPWINVKGYCQPPACENMPYLKVKVTPWVTVIGYVSHQKVKICHISVPCNHIITINGSTPRF